MIQHLVNGLIQGGIYALIALSYTMVYGILGMINFAHGEIYMIGTYLAIITLGVLTVIGAPFRLLRHYSPAIKWHPKK